MRRLFLCLIGLALPGFAVAQEAQKKPTLVLDAGGHTYIVPKVLFSPDGKELASVSVDKSIRIWDVATGEVSAPSAPPPDPAPSENSIAAALSPDGKTLAVAGYGLAQRLLLGLPDLLARRRRPRVLKGHTKSINTLAFSPDGKRLASASGDKTARVWDVNTGENTLTLRGHTESVRGAAWSPDGGRLATASNDKTARSGRRRRARRRPCCGDTTRR